MIAEQTCQKQWFHQPHKASIPIKQLTVGQWPPCNVVTKFSGQ